MVTSKHLFFLIVGLNILVTVVFWNLSRPQYIPPSSPSPATTTDISSKIEAKKIALFGRGDKSPTVENNIVGQYLKAQGGPTYVFDENDPEINFNNLEKAKKIFKASKQLEEYNITLGKSKYNIDEVVKFVHHAADKFKNMGADLKRNYSKELELLAYEFLFINSSYVKLQDDLARSNPFRYYGLYTYIEDWQFNDSPQSRARYDRTIYGIKKEKSYCDLADVYNLFHPSNIYGKPNFFVDYMHGALVRSKIVNVMGYDAMPNSSMSMEKEFTPQFPLNINTTIYFTKRYDIHHFIEVSVNFACITQQYGHIPGHGVLVRKDLNVMSVNNYAKRYANKSQCFNRKTFFPMAFRLNQANECKEFFKFINSSEYKDAKPKEPIQFLLKAGHSAHRASGLELFDEEHEKATRKEYANGAKCGNITDSLVAQYYISNPLLLDKKNKFDFRIYMLVASVNPPIVYYHDGFLRLSLQEYDKWSKEKNVHFTNTHLSKELFAKAASLKEYKGMTEEQLRDYQMWTMTQLADYLLKVGKVNDSNWLNNYLRPKFQEAFIHTVRMSQHSFMNHSGVWEMFGLDFLLDDDLNLWFIECNGSPQLIGTNELKTEFLTTMLTDMFEIVHAYLKSRFKRIQIFMAKLLADTASGREIDRRKIKIAFAQISKNKLEPEFPIRANNTFTLIMDKNIPGSGAYFGHLKDECIDF